MPQIEFTLPRGALSGDAIDGLMAELTTTLLRYEGAPDNEASREISWGYVHEVDRVYNAGAPLNGGSPKRCCIDSRWVKAGGSLRGKSPAGASSPSGSGRWEGSGGPTAGIGGGASSGLSHATE